MIESIIFDFDSTLVDYHYSDTKAIHKVASLISEDIDKSQFLEKSGEIIVDICNSGAVLGSEVHKERLVRTTKYFGFEWKESYLAEYLKIYLNEIKLYKGVLEVLGFLKGKVHLGLLTNSIDIYEQKMRIKNSNLASYFDVICVAAEIGAYKPDREAFEIILSKLSSDPEKSVFIGDSEEYDIRGSKNVGMIAIKKDNNSQKFSIADYRFSQFFELFQILEQISLH